MDDQTLANQYAETRDLMDLCNTDAWLHESAQMEAAADGQVEAGLAMQAYHRAVQGMDLAQSQAMRQQMQLQSMLFTGLQQWMASWDLGVGFDAAYGMARRLIREHLTTLTPSQQVAVEQMLATVPSSDRLDQLTQGQVVAVLTKLLTSEDWQMVAQAASQSITDQVLNARQISRNSAAA
ncbi:hypothetical protein [Trichocoleus sp. FACHB-262]|uniref:hypothetical protein n=1 Tax=Trichocoleus sp. FACHB-262 TaxID=2692869 RepID=UPI001689EFED|nr:hypothetical protein [Trichocoleus sp. FACHB-262]MBD2121299.1 hypothetical protein [Trichocoleus sp. FACHB-262]